MPITLANTRITVEWQVGDPKGDSWGNPYTLDDIVAASVAGSWSPAVTKQGVQYLIPYSLYIIGTDTYFLAENSQVYLEYVAGVDTYQLYVTGNFKSQGNYGMSWYNDYDYGHNGVNLNSSSGVEIYINNSEFIRFRQFRAYGSFGNTVKIENTKFVATDLIYVPCNAYVDVKNLVFYQMGLTPFADFNSAENIQFIKCSLYAVYVWNLYTLNLTNVQSIDPTGYDLRIRPIGAGQVANFYDSKLDFSSRTILSYAIGDWTINNISTFKINIEDGDSGTANLYDKDDNLIFSEVLSGELEKSVTFEMLEVATIVGEVTNEELSIYEPFKLVVSKSGYMDLIIPDITVNDGEQTVIFGKLEFPTTVIYGSTLHNSTIQ